MDKFWKAYIDGYFDKLELDEEIDFIDYNMYQKMRNEFGLRLKNSKHNTSDDSDSDDE